MKKKHQRNTRVLCALIIGCFMICYTAFAQDGITTQVEILRKDSATTVPPASEIDALVLSEAVRGCLSVSANQLLKMSETNYMSFVIPPRTPKYVLRYEEEIPYEAHYREEKFQVPIYKDIYEEYETFAVSGGSSTEARSMQKIKAKRLVGREKIGTREETRLVGDPEGSITRTLYRYGKPVYSDGQDIYQAGVIGANALIYVALRKCGVPETNPIMESMFQEFEGLLNNYAIPDYTWDVAWLTAAFCNNHQARYNVLREWLVSKLVDAQIKEGPGRGFWGPICIDTTLVPALLAYEQVLNVERKAAQTRLKEKPTDQKREQYVQETEANLALFIKNYRFITQQGLRFNDCTSYFNATVDRNVISPISVTGLPYYYFNQTLADMDSTFYALYAIREAYENGYLPDETKRIITAAKRPIAPPEKPVTALARMAAALTSRQQPNGQWDECNTHQPITSFEALGLPDLQPEERFSLDSSVTHLSTAQGFACLLNAGHVVGLDRLFNRYGSNAKLAMQARRDAVLSFLGGQTAGRSFEPYDFFLAVQSLHRHLGGHEESDRDLWTRIAYKLVTTQNPNGTWSKEQENTTIFSSSLLQFTMRQAELAHKQRQKNLEPDKRTEFNRAEWLRQYTWSPNTYMQASLIKTAMAMLFLTDGMRLPAAGYVMKADGLRTPPPVMAKVVELLQSRDKVDVTYTAIGTNTVPADLAGIPVVFLTADSDLSNPVINRVLRYYCDHGGTIVAEIATSAQIAAMQSSLKSLVEGGTSISVPETAPCFANFSGPKPKLSAIANSKGRSVIYIIPLDTIAASPAIQTAYLLVKDNVTDGFFASDYASKLTFEEGTALRLKGISQIKADEAQSKISSEKKVLVTDTTVKTDTGTVIAPAAATAPSTPPPPAGPKADEVW